ncbi:YjgN family protein [Zophobihabitans entericus]|uniref:DUF898 domain-containing protein n=1 Tax=Zophobihabitans entericus TaxID=1635327 RepID=A0A6G9IAI7_9GAMM|nr:DUF898 family protein [Zophobihabitans entericus]QIQ21245.1 DUF898 domain-containing protein [Zophobihabitans entericus]
MQQNQHTVKFHGTLGECFKIYFLNLLLIICTLGIYSFWAIINLKRYFYQNMEVNGYRFNFHATPIQYLIGFLIALAFYFVFVFLMYFAPKIAPIFILIAFCFLPWLIVKSWQFHMRMTSLNGVHFSFRGDIGRAYWVLLIAPLLLILGFVIVFAILAGGIVGPMISGGDFSLSVIAIICLLFIAGIPPISAILNSMGLTYFVNNIFFGEQKFQGEFKKSSLIKIEYIAWLCQAPFLFAIFKFYFDLLTYVVYVIYYPDIYLNLIIQTTFYLILSIIFFVVIGSAYRMVAIRNFAFNQTSINGIQLKSTLQVLPFIWLMVSNLFMIIFTVGLTIPFAQYRFVKYLADNSHLVGDFKIEQGDEDVNTSEANPEFVTDAIISTL